MSEYFKIINKDELSSLERIIPNSLINADCLDVLKYIPDNSVDLVLTDPPYEVTQNTWDIIIPFEPMWKELTRIIKPNGAIILFSDGLFTAKLKLSNTKMWRYDLVWNKVHPSGFLNSNKMPLRSHEMISVFYKKLPVYNPQKYKGEKNHSKGSLKKNTNNNYGKFNVVDNANSLGSMKFPKSILHCPKPAPATTIHPTQKPVELLEFLIKSYSNNNETVLDFSAGSFSTGVACYNTDRNFIGIELDEKHFKNGTERLVDYIKCPNGQELDMFD